MRSRRLKSPKAQEPMKSDLHALQCNSTQRLYDRTLENMVNCQRRWKTLAHPTIRAIELRTPCQIRRKLQIRWLPSKTCRIISKRYSKILARWDKESLLRKLNCLSGFSKHHARTPLHKSMLRVSRVQQRKSVQVLVKISKLLTKRTQSCSPSKMRPSRSTQIYILPRVRLWTGLKAFGKEQRCTIRHDWIQFEETWHSSWIIWRSKPIAKRINSERTRQVNSTWWSTIWILSLWASSKFPTKRPQITQKNLCAQTTDSTSWFRLKFLQLTAFLPWKKL